MKYRLPPLASLRLFEAAARHLSFKKAADELGLTPSAVSHGIDNLESWLGTPLFLRSGRNLSLNQAGEDYLPYVREGLSMIATGTRRTSPIMGEKRIHVTAAPTFAKRWLTTRLSRFRDLMPDVQLHIDTSHRQAVFPLDGVDVAIRMGSGPWPGAKSELLFSESLQPVTSPTYLTRILSEGQSVDWELADLIHVSSVENDWATWLDAQAIETAGAKHIYFDNAELALEGAAHGLGVALCRLPVCASSLDGRSLTPLPVSPLPIQTGYWVLLPAGREPRREVGRFVRWLRDEAESSRE